MGEWNEGSYEGWGLYRNKSGSNYIGQFKDDKRVVKALDVLDKNYIILKNLIIPILLVNKKYEIYRFVYKILL